MSPARARSGQHQEPGTANWLPCHSSGCGSANSHGPLRAPATAAHRQLSTCLPVESTDLEIPARMADWEKYNDSEEESEEVNSNYAVKGNAM